jgi:hypothetical protein
MIRRGVRNQWAQARHRSRRIRAPVDGGIPRRPRLVQEGAGELLRAQAWSGHQETRCCHISSVFGATSLRMVVLLHNKPRKTVRCLLDGCTWSCASCTGRRTPRRVFGGPPELDVWLEPAPTRISRRRALLRCLRELAVDKRQTPARADWPC